MEMKNNGLRNSVFFRIVVSEYESTCRGKGSKAYV